MRKPIALFFILFFVFGCVSAPTSENTLSFQQVADNPNAFHQKDVYIKGYILADALGGISLYKTISDAVGDKAYDAIDLMPFDIRLTKRLRFKQATCVIVHGKFQAYGHGEITFDLPSKYGALHADSYWACN
ncbi:MAG TPA: hypothetical protein VGM16_07895 [Gammaproteobacteria bacterium]|jgi:hypothetical protein